MDLGHRIKELRLSLDMTQEELAQKTGFQTKGAISRIESGLRDLNQNQIMKFAEVLSTTPAYLMGWDKEKTSANAIPLVGTIAAGSPILAEQNIEDYFNIDSSVKCASYSSADSLRNAHSFASSCVIGMIFFAPNLPS